MGVGSWLIDHAPHIVPVNFDRLPLNYCWFVAVSSVVMGMCLNTMEHGFKYLDSHLSTSFFFFFTLESAKLQIDLWKIKSQTNKKNPHMYILFSASF